MERPDNTITAADDQCPLTDKIEGDKITGLGHISNMAGQLPVATKQRFAFQQVEFFIGVTPAREPFPPLGNRRVQRWRTIIQNILSPKQGLTNPFLILVMVRQ